MDTADLLDTEFYWLLRKAGVTAAQAAWVLNNRDDPEAQAFIARVAGS